MGVTLTGSGDFKQLERFLESQSKKDLTSILEKYGRFGCELLAASTPKRTGLTAASWTFKIDSVAGGYTLTFENSNENKGVSIALILDKGHGTRNGGYVRGRHYITPAIDVAWNSMLADLWKEVTSA